MTRLVLQNRELFHQADNGRIDTRIVFQHLRSRVERPVADSGSISIRHSSKDRGLRKGFIPTSFRSFQ